MGASQSSKSTRPEQGLVPGMQTDAKVSGNPYDLLNRMRGMLLDYVTPLSLIVRRPEGIISTTTSIPGWTDGNAIFAAVCPIERTPAQWWNAIQLHFQLKGARPKTVRFGNKDAESRLSEFFRTMEWQEGHETAWIHTLKDVPPIEEDLEFRWLHPSRDGKKMDDFFKAAAGGRADVHESMEGAIARLKALPDLSKGTEVASCVVYKGTRPLVAGAMIRRRQAGFVLHVGIDEPLSKDFRKKTGNNPDDWENAPPLYWEALTFMFKNAVHLAQKAEFKGLGMLSLSGLETSAAEAAGFRPLATGSIWRSPRF